MAMDKKQLTSLCRKAALSMQKSWRLASMARDEVASYLGYEDYSDYEENVSEDWSDYFIDTVEQGQSTFTMDDLNKVIFDLRAQIERSKDK